MEVAESNDLVKAAYTSLVMGKKQLLDDSHQGQYTCKLGAGGMEGQHDVPSKPEHVESQKEHSAQHILKNIDTSVPDVSLNASTSTLMSQSIENSSTLTLREFLPRVSISKKFSLLGHSGTDAEGTEAGVHTAEVTDSLLKPAVVAHRPPGSVR